MPRPLPRPLSALALLALCALPLAVPAQVQLDVVDRDAGQWLPPLPHRGDRWIEGTPGHRYAVRLTNTSDRRVLVVLSVDGVNAITGQTASPSQSGYVLEPWQTAQIDGWRKSMRHVAQFVFTDLPDSYAARTGRPDDVGVIGIAVFEEARPWHAPPIARAEREDAAAKPAASPGVLDEARAQAQSIGTGHGDREWSRASRTDFVRASRSPAQVSEVRYDDRRSLVARGVLPSRAYSHAHRPRAFPGGFVPDPPGD
ncbi:MAG TPA: hypothetical protein VGD42_12250 [Lysobacter sp.]